MQHLLHFCPSWVFSLLIGFFCYKVYKAFGISVDVLHLLKKREKNTEEKNEWKKSHLPFRALEQVDLLTYSMNPTCIQKVNISNLQFVAAFKANAGVVTLGVCKPDDGLHYMWNIMVFISAIKCD